MQDFFQVLTVLCGGAVFILSMVRAYKGRSSNQKFIEDAKKNGRTAEAMKVDTWVVAGRHESSSMEARYPTQWALYLYYVNGKKYTIRQGVKIGPGNRNYVPPDTITIFYKKGNPKKAITYGQATDGAKMQRGCLLSVLYAFLVMYALAWIFGKLGLVGI